MQKMVFYQMSSWNVIVYEIQKCVMLSHLTWSRLIFYKKYYVIRTDTPLGSDTPPTKDANDNLIHKNVLHIQNHKNSCNIVYLMLIPFYETFMMLN